MAQPNHYHTLQVSVTATQAEIKQAYRRLAKQFHPDSNLESAGHEQIVRLNAAYEVLGDKVRRQSYDEQLLGTSAAAAFDRNYRSAAAQTRYQQHRQSAPDPDQHLQQWIVQVYKPVNQILAGILKSLTVQIDQLSADPFDDQLLDAFQAYLNHCRQTLNQAQRCFRSMPNPRPAAAAAANLYYCLNQVDDALEELEMFPLNYDDGYLHTGQEMFRIAAGLRRQAQADMRSIF